MFYKILLCSLLGISALSSSLGGLENLESFEADFSQKITNEEKKTLEYKGKVFIKNNGKVLWKYETPIIKNVYVINNTVIIDEPELEQAIYSNLEENIDMIKLLKKAKKIDKNTYETKLYSTLYKITTKNEKISSLSYKDELENSILISFTNISNNRNIDDKIFNFLVPKNYDIIKK